MRAPLAIASRICTNRGNAPITMPLPPRQCCLLLVPCLLTAGAATAQNWLELPTAVPTAAVVWDAARHRLLLAGTDSQHRLYE